MSLGVEIKDNDSDQRARVTQYGQLVTAPLQYSTPVFRSLSVINTPFNFVEPQPGNAIVITDMLFSADKNVSQNDPAEILIYQSDGVASLVNVATLVAPQLLRSSNQAITGLNMIVPDGRWVNATTTDNIIFVTLMYYYVPAPRTL